MGVLQNFVIQMIRYLLTQVDDIDRANRHRRGGGPPVRRTGLRRTAAREGRVQVGAVLITMGKRQKKNQLKIKNAKISQI